MSERLLQALVALMLVPGVLACGAKQDPIEALLADLERAAEARDAGGIERYLAPGFATRGGMPRAEVAPTLRRYFAAYESVSLEVYEVTIERQEDAARVSFRVDFSGRSLNLGGLSGLLPPSAMFRFDLGLTREGEGWKIASADWEEVLPQAAP